MRCNSNAKNRCVLPVSWRCHDREKLSAILALSHRGFPSQRDGMIYYLNTTVHRSKWSYINWTLYHWRSPNFCPSCTSVYCEYLGNTISAIYQWRIVLLCHAVQDIDITAVIENISRVHAAAVSSFYQLNVVRKHQIVFNAPYVEIEICW